MHSICVLCYLIKKCLGGMGSVRVDLSESEQYVLTPLHLLSTFSTGLVVNKW